jgi:hypothetical protein
MTKTSELAVIKPPSTPATARHRLALSQYQLNGSPLEIAGNRELIPEADCHAVIAEMNAALIGMDAKMATALADLITGSYPNAKPDNPDAYFRSITIVCQACPPDQHQDLYLAVINRPGREGRFPPVANEVAEIIAQQTLKRRAAIAVAEAHLKKHAAAAAAAPPAAVTKEEIEDLRRQYPEAFGISQPKPKGATDPAGPSPGIPIYPSEEMSDVAKNALRKQSRARAGHEDSDHDE